MSSIGLYDLDLLHSPKSWPNLELMKVYNYFHKQGDQVILMNKKEDEGRYNKIIYFKDNKKLQIPKGINVIGRNKQIYGEGFFNTFSPLPEKYSISPPDPIVYLTVCNKFKTIKWNNFIRSSIVRFSNNDMTGYKPEAKDLYIVDRDFCALEGAADFLLEYKQKTIHFFHTLRITSIEDYNLFSRFTLILSKPLFIDFKFNKEFLLENINEKLHFNVYTPQAEETDKDFKIRTIKMGIIIKNKKALFIYNQIFMRDRFQSYIAKWIAAPAQNTYAQYYKDNKEALAFMNNASTEIRLLLKSNPQTTNIEIIDF